MLFLHELVIARVKGPSLPVTALGIFILLREKEREGGEREERKGGEEGRRGMEERNGGEEGEGGKK